MKKYLFPLLFFSIFFSLTNISFAHSGNVMIGFVDGLRHPVIGLDHLVAMISVGVISALIGGFAIWFVPGLFVIGMLMGSSLAVLIYYLRNITNPNQFVLYLLDNFANYIYFIVEFGIAFSVLFLGSIICFNKKLSLIYISVIIFFIWNNSWSRSWNINSICNQTLSVYFRVLLRYNFAPCIGSSDRL